MVVGYFADLEKVLDLLKKILRPRGHVVAAVGDSQYGGVRIDTAGILAEIAERHGFEVEAASEIRSMRVSAQHGGGFDLSETALRLRSLEVRGRVMEAVSSESKFYLPKIESVELSAFDLYRRKPDVGIGVDRSVFCLIGANGLGKSTYLISVIYGLTGCIPYRARSFSSPREYLEEASRLERRNDYYRGRLSEAAAEHATITVRFRVRNTSLSVTRQCVGAGAVTALKVEADGGLEPENFSDTLAAGRYQELVVAESGLPSFEQFVFLMHYVCAFYEDRHLLLWDSTALTNALYLAFGSDAEQAAEANDLKRLVERLGSRARNSRFAARQSLDEAERLQKVLSGDEGGERYEEATLENYERLNKRLDDAGERVHRKEAELRKSEAAVADRSAVLTGLQLEYDEAFTARRRRVFGGGAPPAYPFDAPQ